MGGLVGKDGFGPGVGPGARATRQVAAVVRATTTPASTSRSPSDESWRTIASSAGTPSATATSASRPVFGATSPAGIGSVRSRIDGWSAPAAQHVRQRVRRVGELLATFTSPVSTSM
ncbi:MAG: hypothetical protein U0W40_19230 [Acidimicrobiia bacterium]